MLNADAFSTGLYIVPIQSAYYTMMSLPKIRLDTQNLMSLQNFKFYLFL